MKTSRIILPSFLLLLFTISFSYVYASFSNEMTVSATATIEKPTIMINSVQYKSMSGGASFSNLSHTVNSATMPVTLDAGASIVFDVTVTNYTQTNYEISDMQFNNDNLDVLFTNQGCFLADNIDALNSYTCNITITNTGNSTISDSITATYTYTPISDYTLVHHIETLTNGIDEGYIDDIKDDTTDTHAYHYVGTNPRNYVFFMGEMWRILGLEYNVKSALNGSEQTKVKLVKESSIESNKHIYDITDNINYNMGRGTAEWSTSKLHDTLNNLYYTSGSGNCYLTEKSKTTTACDFSTTGLKSNSLVSASVWYHGASSSTPGTPLQMYNDLHGNQTASSSGCSGLGCNTGTFTTSSVNYVGLISPADYGFTTNGSNGRSRANCLNTALNNDSWKTNGYCATSWLTHDHGIEWTIQPSIGDSYSWVFTITKEGIINDEYAYKRYYIRPSIYLDPKTHYYSGSGLKDDPYIIDQSDAENMYVISFDANGGTGTMPDQIFKYGTNKALSPNKFTREGYSFLGWSANPNDTTATFADKAYVTAVGNATLYAIWFKEKSIYEYMETHASNATIDFSQSSAESNTNGIYTYTGSNSDGGNKTIYYYRGNVDNNVIFAGQCWKIIRTTSTGGAKLIYNGDVVNGECPGTVSNPQDLQTAFNTISTAEASGYMYDTGVQHGTTNDSTVKTANDTFIYYNLRGYVSYLEDITFCNDRTILSGETYSSNGSQFKFNRYNLSSNPTLTCPNANDNYTVDPSHGNGKLSMPVGTITADEAILAGAKNGEDAANSTYYLKTSYQYWTATPRYWNGSKVKVWRINTDGSIGTADSDSNNKYIRPVIALNNTSFLGGGKGTTSDPFTIKNNGIEQYAISYDGNQATSGAMTYQLAYAGEDVRLNHNEFTRTGYHFLGWSTRYDGTVLYDDEETVNLTGDLILYAVWEADVITFTSMETLQTYTVSKSGTYQIDAYGAQGGTYNNSYGRGGNGGHTSGRIYLNNGEVLTIVTGTQPASNLSTGSNSGTQCTGSWGGCGSISGGYNGGGLGYHRVDCYEQGGGGATHVSRNNDNSLYTTLNTYSSADTAANFVLLVAGGGGGATGYQGSGGRYGTGGVGGGTTGGNGAYSMNSNCESYGYGGTQSAGGGYYVLPGHAYYNNVNLPAAGFGFGGAGDAGIGGSGGGAGWYGGRGNSCLGGGGGGSSYLSSSLTVTVNEQGTNAGNGKVVITYLG